MKSIIVIAFTMSALTGCDVIRPKESKQTCFTMTPSSATQPYSALLLDECSGESWLLVRTRLDDKPNGDFTYQWMKIQRLDYVNPTLSR